MNDNQDYPKEPFAKSAESFLFHSGAGLLVGLAYQMVLLGLVFCCVHWSPDGSRERYITVVGYDLSVRHFLPVTWAVPTLCLVGGVLLHFLVPQKRLEAEKRAFQCWKVPLLFSLLIFLLNILLVHMNLHV